MVNISAERFSPKRLSPQRVKARLEPHMHLKVPMEKGVYQDSRWSNPDLDPIKPEDRTWGALVGGPFSTFLLTPLTSV
jgi:hypothetical protein